MTNATNPSLSEQAEALLARVKHTDLYHEPFDINDFVHRLLACDGKIAALWGIEDVQSIRPDLADEQAMEVLEEVGRKHDAEYGISWPTLECMADILFGHAHETDEATEAQP